MAIQKFTVSSDDSVYEAWPDVVKTDSGKLICVFAECTHHVDRNNARIVICESQDRGRTWSAKKPLTDRGDNFCFFNCARISKLKDGSLAIICDKVSSDTGRVGELSNSEIYVWYADAEGKQWSEPQILPFCGIVPDKLLELSCGRRIITAHFLNEETEKLEQYLWYSDDKGATWSERVTLAADKRYNLCEASLIEEPDGTLISFMRENSRAGYPVFKSVSYDKGETWEGVFETSLDSGHRPTAGYLSNGQVMVTYRYIPHWMENVFAAFLNAEELKNTERSSQKARIMPLDYDRNEDPDLGYTGWVQFDDGEIYVVNYIKDDKEKAQIRGYSFFMQDVVLSETEKNATVKGGQHEV